MQSVSGIQEVPVEFLWINLGEGNYLEDPGVDERIILKWISEKWDGCMDWSNLAQDKDR